MPVYTIGGKKINADSQSKAQYLYDSEWGSGAKKTSSSKSSSSSSSPTRTSTPSAAPVSTSSYSGGSIVDYLRGSGQASDFNSRSALAAKSGITGYTGSAAQNTQLLNAIRSRSSTPTPSPKDTYVNNQRDGLANASNLSATTPEKTAKKTSTTPDYRQQYVDFLAKAYPTDDVAGARESLSTLQKRIADTTIASRHEDDRIRTNESGALARGINYQIGENERVSARELGDLGIAAAPLASVLEGAEGAYRTLANLTPTENEAFTLSEGQTRYQLDPATGEYRAVGTVGKSGDPLKSLTSSGSLKSGSLNYSSQDYTEDSNALEQSRGGDGWVDPAVYQRLYQSWLTSGGVADDFVNLYPPERYANPINNTLPGTLRNSSGGNARTQVVEIGGRRVLINVDTGDTIRDLGVALGTGGDSGWGL